MSGKGSRPRPIPNRDKFDEAWDNIFGSKSKTKKDSKASGLNKEKEKRT